MKNHNNPFENKDEVVRRQAVSLTVTVISFLKFEMNGIPLDLDESFLLIDIE